MNVFQDMELQSQVYDPMSSWQKEYARMKVRFTSAYEPQLTYAACCSSLVEGRQAGQGKQWLA